MQANRPTLLEIWTLNVGKGDSIILKYSGDEGTSFGLIDSNKPFGGESVALEKLIELGATELSFVALTHPHADHYTGLLEILQHFRGKIDLFYSYPMFGHRDWNIDRVLGVYKSIYDSAESLTVKRNLEELIRIFVEVRDHIGFDNWPECVGPGNELRPKGFDDVEMQVMLPFLDAKGPVFEKWRTGNYDIAEQSSENMLSLAFKVEYKGCEIILGGDAPHSEWAKHKRWARNKEPNACAVHLPHHGSKKDCSEGTLQYVYSDNEGSKIALISANGRSHPHSETLSRLKSMGIEPYCTNLHTECGNIVKELFNSSEITPELNRLINTHCDTTDTEVSPCQGNIKLSIDAHGCLELLPEYSLPCAYRGSYDGLPT